MGRRNGLAANKIRALAGPLESGPFDAVERTALAYADAVTDTPAHVADELFDDLRTHLGEPAIIELTSVIAWENYRARMYHAIEAESESFDGETCLLPRERTEPA